MPPSNASAATIRVAALARNIPYSLRNSIPFSGYDEWGQSRYTFRRVIHISSRPNIPNMNPIRQIIEDSPESITIPQELRHKRIEVIIWPLEEADIDQKVATNDGWPAGLFERTAGAWQGEPLTREPQGDYEQRLEWE
jgi:hypothetical protein